ncbi:NADP-dependent oxidoreductase [Phenylobacterium sp.]|uniref:NADP-dependent oxidoreductase n=1 Tax=Phenylobacterium sp. TaxID=1871053 RepID=UPI00289E9AFD|nr:NADP-dependent oxidoreductase [Phenylobacterium sp.]
MRAYVLQRYGDAGNAVLTDFPAPTPGPHELLVAVRAAGLNPVDIGFRKGRLRPLYRLKLPIVLGCEFAGEVVAVGATVTRFSVGDRVYARVEKDRPGAFAELAVVSEDYAALAPAVLDLETAAGVPLAALTALQALRDELHVAAGQKVFISGGAGGVGTFAIQIAKLLGAHVTTTASPRGEALVRALGADAVIDYTSDDLSRLDREFDAGLDLVGGATLERMFQVVKPGAKVVSVAAVPEPRTAMLDLGGRKGLAALFWLISRGVRRQARAAGVDYRYMFMRPSGADLAQLAQWIADGQLQVVIDRTFPFSRIADAMAYLEAGRAKGKVVVSMTAAG